jgi:hypothetical protein
MNVVPWTTKQTDCMVSKTKFMLVLTISVRLQSPNLENFRTVGKMLPFYVALHLNERVTKLFIPLLP